MVMKPVFVLTDHPRGPPDSFITVKHIYNSLFCTRCGIPFWWKIYNRLR